MSESPLENETAGDTTTFEWFPTRRHHKHIRETKRILREEGVLDADDVAKIYLPADEYEALVEMDLPVDDLSGLANQIAAKLGFGDSGNSSPSPTSS